MIRPSPLVTLAVALLVLASTLAGCRGKAASATGREGEAPGSSTPFDAETTDTARVIAGMPPLGSGAFASIVSLPDWLGWESESRVRWSVAWGDRVKPLRDWASAALAADGGGCQTLLQPFGGTEFLFAYSVFPSCEGYVLVGSEPVGQLPSLDAATPTQLAGYFEDVRRAFPEVFTRSTARHTTPSAGPKLAGAIPSLLVQLARLDAHIVSASRFDITTDGRPLESIPIRGGNARPAALSLTFEVPNGRPQSLVYFPADLDDAAMRRRPGAWTFLRMQAPFVTLLAPRPPIAAARCSLVRDLILDQSRAILQAGPAWTPVRPPDWTVTELATPPASMSARLGAPTLAVKALPAAKPGSRR
jgi:hypothetical protein